MSFLTLGIFWVGQQTSSTISPAPTVNLSWINLAFLFAVSLMPFSTALMAEFIAYRVALLCTGRTSCCLGSCCSLVGVTRPARPW